MTTIPSVAVDDGFAQVKVVSIDDNGAFKCQSLRSSIRHGAIASVSGNGAVATYSTDDGQTKMSVSDEVAGESTRFDGFHTSAMNRILIAHGLMAAGFANQTIDLCAGLPVSDYFLGEARNEELIDRKCRNLNIPVESLVPDAGACPKYRSIEIGCQAIAAFMDYAIDDSFRDREDIAVDRVGVVDVGGRTTDIAVILGGERYDADRCGTENIGVLNIHEAVSSLIRREFKTSEKYSADVIDRAVRSGSVRLWGKQIDIKHIIDEAKQETAQKLRNTITRMIGSASDLDAVLFVGGGAALFADMVKEFPNGVLPDDPEFSNAKGLLKFMKVSAS